MLLSFIKTLTDNIATRKAFEWKSMHVGWKLKDLDNLTAVMSHPSKLPSCEVNTSFIEMFFWFCIKTEYVNVKNKKWWAPRIDKSGSPGGVLKYCVINM